MVTFGEPESALHITHVYFNFTSDQASSLPVHYTWVHIIITILQSL